MSEPTLLTDEEIFKIADPFIGAVGGHWEYEMTIEEKFIEDFARAIESAVIKANAHLEVSHE
jgi:hypothetical protein